MTKRVLLVASLPLVLAACGGNGSSAETPGPDGGEGANGNGNGHGGADAGGEGSEVLPVVEQAFTRSEGAMELPAAMAALSVDAALEATRLHGADAFTGTLTQQSADSYTYSAEPSDRLRLEFLDGRTWEFTFRALQGDFSGDGARFASELHNLDMDVSSNAAAGDLDLVINSQPVDGTQVGRIAGAFTEDGVRWNIDLSFEASTRAEVGTGTEYEVIRAIQGTAGAASQGIAMEVDRYYRYIQVNLVENIDHRLAHTLTVNGQRYDLAGRVFVGLRESQPVDRDQWVIEGQLLRDGALLHAFAAEEDPRGLTIWLGTGPDRVKLFFFSYL